MDNDAEGIRRNMMETRAAMADKIAELEQHVQGTIDSTSARVDNALDAVTGTIDSVRNSVEETKERVSNAVNLPQHVSRHPWGMVLGAAALGYLGTRYANQPNGHHPTTNGQSNKHTDDGAQISVRAPEPPIPAPMPAPAAPGFAHKVGDIFHDEIQMLKGLALGTLFGIIRDMAMKSAPDSMNQPLEEAINQLTVKLGGQPIRGRILSEYRPRRHEPGAPDTLNERA